MTITLDGSSLTIEKLVVIARDNEKVELAPEALERIKICRAMLEQKLTNVLSLELLRKHYIILCSS